MRRAFSLICFITLIACAFGQPSSVKYKVIFNKENPSKVDVCLSYKMESPNLDMAAGANQLEDRWSTFISDIKATSYGQPVKITSNGNANWSIHGEKGKKVDVTYSFNLNHEDHTWNSGIDGVAYQQDESIFISGRSLFILPSNDGPYEVVFNVPDGWNVETPWSSKQNGNIHFQIENTEELTQSGMVVGKFDSFSIDRSGFELNFAVCSEKIKQKIDEFKKMGRSVFDYYICLMGDIPNIHGSGSKKSLIVLGEGSRTDGEVLGRTVSILLKSDGNQMDDMIGRFIFAHEFFHLWTGKSIRVQDNTMDWFKEGFTNYYTLKSLKQTGWLDEQVLYGVLNDLFYQRYIHDEGLDQIALIDGEAKHDHWGIIYGGGLFAGIAQDMIIRSASDNQSNLDEVMKALFEDFGGTERLLTLDELEKRLSDASGEDQSKFFQTYIHKPTIIPIEQYLKLGGMNSEVNNQRLTIQPEFNETSLHKDIREGFLGQINCR